MFSWWVDLLNSRVYWWWGFTLGTAVGLGLFVAVYLGYRRVYDINQRKSYWYVGSSPADSGEGWIMFWLLFVSLIGSLVWPVGWLIAGVLLVRALAIVVLRVPKAARDRRALQVKAQRRDAREALLSQARDWDNLANDTDSNLTPDMVMSCRAKAIELRGEAARVGA